MGHPAGWFPRIQKQDLRHPHPDEEQPQVLRLALLAQDDSHYYLLARKDRQYCVIAREANQYCVIAQDDSQ